MKLPAACLSIACQLIAVFSWPACAYKPGDFPGQGKYVDWYDAGSFYHQGIDFQQSEQYDQAIEQFHTAITRYGTDSRFYQGLGKTYLERGHGGDNELALEAYRQATVVNDSEWSTWYALADLYDKLGQKHEALVEYRHTLERKPPTKWAKAIQDKIDELEKENHAQ